MTRGLFGDGSVIRRVNIEPAIALGAGCALLLQLAHPAVAQGVADHSDFKRQPFKRLQGTLEATYAVVFGPEQLAEAVGARIRHLHEHVTGASYRANDPPNLMWVHATLVDTAMGCYADLVGPLSAGDAETYYAEMMRVGEVFGLPVGDQPPTLAEFRAYFADAVARMQVSEVGRDLGSFIVDPTLPLRLDLPLWPALRLQRLLSVGRLPPALREQFGFPWSHRDERRLATVQRALRGAFGAVPRPIRTAPTRLNGRYLLWSAQRHSRSDRRSSHRG